MTVRNTRRKPDAPGGNASFEKFRNLVFYLFIYLFISSSFLSCIYGNRNKNLFASFYFILFLVTFHLVFLSLCDFQLFCVTNGQVKKEKKVNVIFPHVLFIKYRQVVLTVPLQNLLLLFLAFLFRSS